MGEPRWIDHLDQIVIDEAPAVARFSSTAAQIILQQRQRADKAGELDQRAVDHSGEVNPHKSWPSPAQKSASHNETDEQQMDDHHNVGAPSIPHLFTCQTQQIHPQSRSNGLATHQKPRWGHS
jgi:hypothetical protein